MNKKYKLIGRHGYNMQHDELREKLGLRVGQKLPAHSIPPTEVNGVWVFVLAAEDAKVRFPKTHRPHRVMAYCPNPDCQEIVPAGRLHQHKCYSIKNARRILRAHDMVLVRVSEGSLLAKIAPAGTKWIVKEKGEPVTVAPYFTNDLEDAVRTGAKMWQSIKDYYEHLEKEQEGVAMTPDYDSRDKE